MMGRFLPSRKLVRRIAPIALAVAVGLAVWLKWPWVGKQLGLESSAAASSASTPPPEGSPRVELVPNQPDTVRIPESLFERPKYKTDKGTLAEARFKTEVVSGTPIPEPLRLRGSIIIDPNRNARIHSLFSGQVVKIGLPGNMAKNSKGLSNTPELGLRPGDDVKQGQILAVIYSKDAGALKTDLLTRLTQLWADQTVLDRYEKTESVSQGVVPPTQLTQLRQTVQSDWVFVRNARRNLRASQFNEEEIQIVEDEAEKLKTNPNAQYDPELERTWAEYLVRAPFDGKLVEKNATLGDAIDPTVDLFKMAKLDKLQVLVDVYEEDLPKIQKIAEEAEKEEKAAMPGGSNNSSGLEAIAQAAGDKVRGWTISYQATGEGETGAFEKLGVVIDPMQHTGTVRGWVNNSRGRLFLGQFVIATIPLKQDPDLVAVPTGAIVETAGMPTLFVRTNAKESQFTQRKVAVVVRGREQIFIRREPNAAERARGAESIQPGDIVISRGSVELSGELETLQSEGKKEPEGKKE
ncbi:MAG TPA: efflux RND transporter periplasmic adaptor subunit [Gemmata sp.]|jgi:cobalt-zinc-cadmium efflux system membrane fusion protein|nr:efflux RND transporter periplasmic adaptor subunit [Gemmata sp.]